MLKVSGEDDGARPRNELELTDTRVRTFRKPDPKFFQLALDRLGVKAEETVFLDDIGHNLAAAAKMGIKTIRKCFRVLQMRCERICAGNAGSLGEAKTLADLEKSILSRRQSRSIETGTGRARTGSRNEAAFGIVHKVKAVARRRDQL